jgi:hypothetical protein
MTYGSDLVESGDAYTRSREVTDAMQESAVLSVVRHAVDEDDALMLLDMLGLTPTAHAMLRRTP